MRYLLPLAPLATMGAKETGGGVSLGTLLTVLIIAAIILFVIYRRVRRRRDTQRLRESREASGQSVYKGASSDLLQLVDDLKKIGVRTETNERDRALENIMKRPWYFFRRSLGLLNVTDGLVRWAIILYKAPTKTKNSSSLPRWWYLFGIPDERISSTHTLKIKTVRKKTFPLFGRVVDTTWKGKDYDTGLVEILPNGKAVDDLAANIGNLVVRSHFEGFQG